MPEQQHPAPGAFRPADVLSRSADLPAPAVVAELLAGLGRALEADHLEVWRAPDRSAAADRPTHGWTVAARWDRPGRSGPDPAAPVRDGDALIDLPGVVATVDVVERGAL